MKTKLKGGKTVHDYSEYILTHDKNIQQITHYYSNNKYETWEKCCFLYLSINKKKLNINEQKYEIHNIIIYNNEMGIKTP